MKPRCFHGDSAVDLRRFCGGRRALVGRDSRPLPDNSARARQGRMRTRLMPAQAGVILKWSYLAWACGAVGSALPWHGRGRRFEPDQVHQNPSNTYSRSNRQKCCRRSPTGVQTPFDAWAAMGIVSILIPAHDQANRFNAVASMGTLGTAFHACRRLPKTTTFRFLYRRMPSRCVAAENVAPLG